MKLEVLAMLTSFHQELIRKQPLICVSYIYINGHQDRSLYPAHLHTQVIILKNADVKG